MENIKRNLTNILKTIIITKYPELNEDQYLRFLNVANSISSDSDYTVKSIVGFQKVVQRRNGFNLPINELFDFIKNSISDKDKQSYNITFEKNNININIEKSYIEGRIKHLLNNSEIVEKNSNISNILVDFSSPNIAKDMHVGHLRSTIIGESICRLFEKLEHNVLRINHIGDFGLQFGMIIELLLEQFPNYIEQNFSIGDLQDFYAKSKKRFDSDDNFKKRSYEKVVLLQSGDIEIVKAWNFIKDISRNSYNEIYEKLDIKLDEKGESFYQPLIPELISELEAARLLQEDDGRKIIKIEGYELPLTIVKSDGGYTYDTTDLAALRYRLVELKMDKVYYVVDMGQSLHFDLCFEVAKKTGWLTNQEVVHIGFGLVLGEDKKKFKSRDGNTIKLNELLNQSIQCASKVYDEHINDSTSEKVTDEERDLIIKNVAYGSIKYADLSATRTNDYIFSFDKMLSLKGNTGAYQLYMYVRICAILRKAGIFSENALKQIDSFNIKSKEELELCKIILLFPEILEKISEDLLFHTLCSYLYSLSNSFSNFHRTNRCLNFDDEKKIVDADINRLLICYSTKKIMEFCFYILGIKLVERM